MFGREEMKRHSRSSSLSSSGSSSSSSGSRSGSASRSRRRILKLKKKLKVHHRFQCRCRSKKVDERRKYKTRYTDRSRRSKCRHSFKRSYWHERSVRNDSEESSDDQRQQSSIKKANQDNRKLCDRSYSLASCNSSRCCCKMADSNRRPQSVSNSCLDVVMNGQEGEDLSRIYYKQKRKKHNVSDRMHRDCQFHNDDDCCKTCFGSNSIFNREQNLAYLAHHNFRDWQAHDIRSHHILNRGSEIEGISACGRQNLVQNMTETRNERTRIGEAGHGNKNDWLMLSLDRARAASLSVKDCESDDFKLCLPGGSQSGMSTPMEEIDLNVAIDGEDGVMRSSTPWQLPPPTSCNLDLPSELNPPVSPHREQLDHEVISHVIRFEDGKNDALAKQHENECLSVAVSFQGGGDIILLDSTEDEHTPVEDKSLKMVRCLRRPKLELHSDEHSLSNAERHGAKNQEDSVPWGDYQANTLTADRSSDFLQTAEGEVVDADGAVCGHEDAGTNSCLQDVANRLHGKGEEMETVENGSAHSVVVADAACIETTGQDLSTFGEHQKSDLNGFKARKKRIVQRPSLFLQEPLNFHENVLPETAIGGKLIVQKDSLDKMNVPKPRMWDADILCDLCHKGPSLFLGEWYSWCCGLSLSKCCCPPELKMKLKSGMRNKKSSKAKKNEELPWSGKVHKMCALWSAEVFEGDEGDRLHGVLDAVRRGKSLTCAGCKDSGATLGCRVKSCHRSYHYPCADRLASKLQCRMWEGVHFPVACHGHRHVVMSCQNAKEKGPDLKNWRKKGTVQRRKLIMSLERLSDTEQGILARCQFYKNEQGEAEADALHGPQPIVRRNELVDGESKIDGPRSGVSVIDLSSDSENLNKVSGLLKFDAALKMEKVCSGENVNGFRKGGSFKAMNNLDWLEVSRHEDATAPLYYMGVNLLSKDMSGGQEELMIPCTNDVDADPVPSIVYMTQSRFLGSTRKIFENLLMDGENLARGCEGCNNFDIDDPHEDVSFHVPLINDQRESDTRMDWQGQPMLGRLPYDRFGRLKVGPFNNDVIECNSRCPCGPNCLNKELQKGLKIPLEVFKTRDRGWGVRTMKQIPRGKFVVEYVGEILTRSEAKERRMKYDLVIGSCLLSVNHPELPVDKHLVVDGYNMSNVARFINHSCEGNLRIFRVYTEVTDIRFCHIGMYAVRDIEIGEELSYDYNNSKFWDMDKSDFSRNPTAIKCHCGSKKCKQWL